MSRHVRWSGHTRRSDTALRRECERTADAAQLAWLRGHRAPALVHRLRLLTAALERRMARMVAA